MTDAFDPYHKWLGIPAEDRPPHHYRLLGIEPLESDPDVIATAADGRMAQVKNFETGGHAAESQRILNEIAAARVCLLNAEKKVAYDRKLRHRLEAESKGIPEAVRPAARQPVPRPDADAQQGIAGLESSSVVSYVASRGRKRRSWQILAAIAVVAVLAVGVVAFLLSRNGATSTARKTETSQTPSPQQPKDDSPGEVPPAESRGPATTDPPTPVPETPDSDPPEPEPDEPPAGPEDEPPEPPADPQPPRLADLPERTLADLIDPPDPSDPDPAGPQPHGPDASTTLPVPDKEARQEAEKKIRDVFKEEFAQAGTADGKAALAAKLFAQGQQTVDDPAARFVLMQLACEMSAEAGELPSMLDRVDQMHQLYDMAPLTFKVHLLEKSIDSVHPGSTTSADGRQVVEAAMQLTDEAVARDDFVMAGRFAKVAALGARRVKDAALIREVTARKQELDRRRQRFLSAKKALDALAENAADPGANLAAGRYYCFYAGNWEKGLPMLAKGNDPALLDLARRDLDLPKDFANQLKLADTWWEPAEGQSSFIKRAMQTRAAYWYRQALPKLAGLDKTRVEKRLETAATAGQTSTSKTRGVVQRGNVALASNGTTVSGTITRPAELFDGEVGHKSGRYAWAGCPSQWTITFDKTYRLQEIRFLPWGKDETRFYRYLVGVSADGKTFTPLADRSLGKWSGWQRISFSPRPVKAIKLIGLYGSSLNRLYVVEFEAYCIVPR